MAGPGDAELGTCDQIPGIAMNAQEIEGTIQRWEELHSLLVSPTIRRKLVEEFDLDTQMECWGILDTLQQVEPGQFSQRG